MFCASSAKRRVVRSAMDSFDQLVQAVRSCTPEQKQRLFAEIRDSIVVHDLERVFNARAEIILEAINRAGDLTQRGVRGLIAETAFVLDVLPTASGWQSDPPIGDVSYDACLRKNSHRVRIQVKTQRRIAGKPMKRGDDYVVEVQRTRGGVKNGVKTRPYRFDEFDLLAVCMWASTGDWHSFMYVPAAGLVPDKIDKTTIRTLQPIPDYKEGDHDVWSKSLTVALGRVSHA
jgi:hypothetical protein